MEQFSYRFDRIENESQYVEILNEIANDMDPENKRNASYYQARWKNQVWKAQRLDDHETEEDLYNRLERCHQLAFPKIYQEDCLRLSLMQDFIAAIADKSLYKHLQKECKTEIYETSNIVKILKEIRAFKELKRQHEATDLTREQIFQGRSNRKSKVTAISNHSSIRSKQVLSGLKSTCLVQ